MSKVNLFLQVYGELGIPIHSRELVSEYLKLNKDISITPIAPGQPNSIPSELRPLLKAPDINYPAFVFWYPQSFEQLVGVFPKTIGYYIFEYTNIPKEYVAIINQLDVICTASEWGRGVLKANGVTTKIEVVPGGVNTKKFNKTLRKKYTNGEQFIFGHVGKLENRKNTELLIESFLSKFKGNDKVKLLLSITNPHIKENPKDIIETKFGKHSNIEFVPFIDDIRNFYKRIHCAVFPTNAEGIGLPIVEAMACGIPTITSFNSGITEYATEENAILLIHLKKIPVYDEHFFPDAGQFGFWETPSQEELAQKMEDVFLDYDTYLKIGDNAADFMENKFSWKIAAEKLDSVIKNVT